MRHSDACDSLLRLVNCHINMKLYDRMLPNALFKEVTELTLLGLHGQVLED